MNLMPITGIPLPFFSYGGSFFLICSLCLGLALPGRVGLEAGWLSRCVATTYGVRVWRGGRVARDSSRFRCLGPPSLDLVPYYPMAVMAWFKKERKPARRSASAWRSRRTPGRSARAAGTSTSGRSSRALNVCPECGLPPPHHGRGVHRAADRRGTWRELYADLRSADPLAVRAVRRPARGRPQEGAATPTRSTPAPARLDRLPFNLGVMNFAFMGGSMGSVVGEKIARLARRSLDKKIPLVLVSRVGRRAHAGGRALADADGQDVRGHRPAAPRVASRTSPSSPTRPPAACRRPSPCRAT